MELKYPMLLYKPMQSALGDTSLKIKQSDVENIKVHEKQYPTFVDWFIGRRKRSKQR